MLLAAALALLPAAAYGAVVVRGLFGGASAPTVGPGSPGSSTTTNPALYVPGTFAPDAPPSSQTKNADGTVTNTYGGGSSSGSSSGSSGSKNKGHSDPSEAYWKYKTDTAEGNNAADILGTILLGGGDKVLRELGRAADSWGEPGVHGDS